MEQQKLFKVTEFAEHLGISPQAVYKRLKKSLNRYVVMVDGVTMIDAAALEAVKTRATFQPTVNQPQTNNNQTQPTVEQPLIDELRQTIAEQKGTIERLQKELDEARADIRHKDEQIEAQSARLLTITENQQELLRNSQILQAQTQKKGFFARLFAGKEQNKSV